MHVPSPWLRQVSSWSILAVLAATLGCDADSATEKPLVAANWESTLTEVRGCRQGPEHDLEYVRLLSDSASVADFNRCAVDGGTCTTPFPEGALFVKPQYADANCQTLVRISVAKKTSLDADADLGGWQWQELDQDLGVNTIKPARCASCHATCEGSFDHRCYMMP